MIKFEFIVDDVDAENILRAIREQAIRSDVSITEYMADTTISESQKESYIGWHRRHKEYMLGLIGKNDRQTSMTDDDTFEALRKAPTENKLTFGRGRWVYCSQHMGPHTTGWCTVSNRDKTLLDGMSAEECHTECVIRDFQLYKGN